MARRPQRKETSATDPTGERKQVPIVLASARDVPMYYANNAIVNFSQSEFLLTVLAAFPEPWRKKDEVPDKIEARVLGRYAFSVPQWVASVRSFQQQIDRLQKAGAFEVELHEEAEEEDAQ